MLLFCYFSKMIGRESLCYRIVPPLPPKNGCHAIACLAAVLFCRIFQIRFEEIRNLVEGNLVCVVEVRMAGAGDDEELFVGGVVAGRQCFISRFAEIAGMGLFAADADDADAVGVYVSAIGEIIDGGRKIFGVDVQRGHVADAAAAFTRYHSNVLCMYTYHA